MKIVSYKLLVKILGISKKKEFERIRRIVYCIQCQYLVSIPVCRNMYILYIGKYFVRECILQIHIEDGFIWTLALLRLIL